MAEDTIVINPTLKRRESAKGKVSFAMEIKSEALIVSLDPTVLEASVAKAIADELRDQVTSISADAAPATLNARAVERKAYAAGKPWAVSRFNGGKLGATPPTTSTKAFNNSGRFAKSIVAAAVKGRWMVNWAANRIDPQTGNVDRIWARLVQLVPAFGDVAKLFAAPNVNKAVKRGLDALVTTGPMSADEFSVARARARLALIAEIVLKAAA